MKVQTRKKKRIVELKNQGKTFKEIAQELGLAEGTVKTHYYLTVGQTSGPIQESRYVAYNEPPEIEGDALVIPDAEIPFHHAEFMNRVLDLADAWGIKQMVAAGDLLHMDSLSGWEPSWYASNSSLSAKAEEKLLDFAKTLPSRKQADLIELIVDSARYEGRGYSTEMQEARHVLKSINDLFDPIVYIMGNHEGRFLRTINAPTEPSELLRMMQLDSGRWVIAPYYYCILRSGGRVIRITHPKTAADNAARALAGQYLMDVLMGHSHKLLWGWDTSGTFYAIHMGHCVDEMRLAYAAQRDAKRYYHKLGAVIVRDGYPWLLHMETPWEQMKKMA